MSTTPPQPTGATFPGRLPGGLRALLRGAAIHVETLPAGQRTPQQLRRESLPLLVLPAGVAPARAGAEIVVALEGRDVAMAERVAELLALDIAPVHLVHVTWLPGTAFPAPVEEGLDDPAPTDLLMYEGASEALVTAAERLRGEGAEVHTHLRFDRHPADALLRFLAGRECALLVLGLGRHGAGIGERILERRAIPILYVDSRPERHDA